MAQAPMITACDSYWRYWEIDTLLQVYSLSSLNEMLQRLPAILATSMNKKQNKEGERKEELDVAILKSSVPEASFIPWIFLFYSAVHLFLALPSLNYILWHFHPKRSLLIHIVGHHYSWILCLNIFLLAIIVFSWWFSYLK